MLFVLDVLLIEVKGKDLTQPPLSASLQSGVLDTLPDTRRRGFTSQKSVVRQNEPDYSLA
jgi:hypothetical protein